MQRRRPFEISIVMRKLGFSFLALVLFFGTGCAKPWDELSGEEKRTLRGVLEHWETWVPARKAEGTAPLMTFDELYSGLGPAQREFLDRVRAINPKKDFGFRGNYLGGPEEGLPFERIENQWITKKGKPEKLDPQYLPENVFRACETLMQAMEKDIGKRLLVESGYRSHAYQLYTYLYYLPKHHYSLIETGHWVALPGWSEHGAPHRQAIDFINQEGINGEDNVEEFERLPEYEWLQKNARRFGFELSYPRGKPGITFEPWHWRFTAEDTPGFPGVSGAVPARGGATAPRAGGGGAERSRPLTESSR